jgi:Fe2+ transport system protein FeoA
MNFNSISASAAAPACAAAGDATTPSRLSRLSVGDRAVVRKVRSERHLALRLLEMGLVPGTEVELTRIAPLGDPVCLRLRDYTLSIRRAEAECVEVTPIPPTRP